MDIHPGKIKNALVCKVVWDNFCETCNHVLIDACKKAGIRAETDLPVFFVPYHWLNAKCLHGSTEKPLLKSVYHGAGIGPGVSESTSGAGGQ